MNCCKRLLIIVSAAALCAVGQANAKSLLEKSIYFVNPESGKTDSCKYWKIYIGTFQAVTLVRKFPGEDSLPVNSDLNLTILSSGYIEGYGYTRKGRVDCMASFVIDTGTGAIKLPVDSIEFVAAGGEKVKPRSLLSFGAAPRQGTVPGMPDDNLGSEYFGPAYSLFDGEDTAEMEIVQDDPDAFL